MEEIFATFTHPTAAGQKVFDGPDAKPATISGILKINFKLPQNMEVEQDVFAKNYSSMILIHNLFQDIWVNILKIKS